MLKAAQDLMAAQGLGRGAQTAVLIAFAGAALMHAARLYCEPRSNPSPRRAAPESGPPLPPDSPAAAAGRGPPLPGPTRAPLLLSPKPPGMAFKIMEICFLMFVEPLTRMLVRRGIGKPDVVRSALRNFCTHGLASGWVHNAIQARRLPPPCASCWRGARRHREHPPPAVAAAAASPSFRRNKQMRNHRRLLIRLLILNPNLKLTKTQNTKHKKKTCRRFRWRSRS